MRSVRENSRIGSQRDILNELRARLPERAIDDGGGRDWDCATGYPPNILGRISVDSELTLTRVVKAAAELGVKLHPISTGRNWGYGHIADGNPRLLVDLGEMRAITGFSETCGTVTVQPGVTQGMLQKFLEEWGGRWIAPITGSSPECSVLANALERGFGLTPYADHFGAIRDLTAVLPDGRRYRSTMANAGAYASAAVSRWGAGPYLHGLFSQSSFGIVSSITLALARNHPPRVLLFRIRSDAMDAAVDALRELRQRLGDVVPNIKLMNPDYIACIKGIPQPTTDWMGWLSLHGEDGVTTAASRHACALLASRGIRSVFLNERRTRTLETVSRWCPSRLGRALRQRAQDARTLIDFVAGRCSERGLALVYRGRLPAETAHPERDRAGILWYVPILKFEAPAVARAVSVFGRILQEYRFPPAINLTALDGHGICAVIAILFDPKTQAAQAEACYRRLYETGLSQGVMPYRLPAFPGLLEGLDNADLHTRLRAAFDPCGVTVAHRSEPVIKAREEGFVIGEPAYVETA
jgi:4-cresol dehydrogenase (hydroxylating) flavoprotein subunit